MKKQMITTVLMLSFLSVVLAQNSVVTKTDLKFHPTVKIPDFHHFELSCFQVDDMVYAQIENAQPNSTAQFYSTIHGGKMLSIKKMDNQGNLQTTFAADAVPGFMLNTETKFVQHFNEKEFILNNLQAKKLDNQIELTWAAKTLNDAHISFEILKSLNGGDFTIVNTLIAANTEQMTDYTFDDAYAVNAIYKIRVVKNNAIYRYTSPEYNTNVIAAFNCYPTLTTDVVHVDATTGIIAVEPYQIINVAGIVVASGNLNMNKNIIDVSQLENGIYFIHTSQFNQKFVKE